MPAYYSIIISLIVAIHSRFCFELVGRIVNTSRYHFLQYSFCVFNGALGFFIIQYLHEFSSVHYFALIVVLFFQTLVIFNIRPPLAAITTCILMLHLFVFRAIIISCFAMANDVSTVEVIISPYLFWITSLLSFILHIFSIIAFNKFLPQVYLKELVKNPDVIMFFLIISTMLVGYMIYNASFYQLDSIARGIHIQQIVLPLMLLSLFYIALLLMIKILDLHHYKEKATELEDAISKEQMLKIALFNMTKIFVEFNCTKDKLTRFVVYEKDSDISKYKSYTDFHLKNTEKFVHIDDKHKSEQILPQNIIEQFNKGITKVTYDYRTPYTLDNDSVEHRWHKLLMHSKIDDITNDIIAFFVVSEIHDEKVSQLALLEKSERDPLTHGLNKEAAETYIQKHLHNTLHGTFFVIDLDNFKNANDNFGHTFGDEVLCTVYKELKKHFRAHDIIARIGGDEFIAFTPETLSLEILETKAHEICKSIHYTYNKKDVSVTVTASVGISKAPEDGTDYATLFEKADQAMYRSKNKGKNLYSFYS